MQTTLGSRALALRTRQARTRPCGCEARTVRPAALPDDWRFWESQGFKDFFDYSSWAPKSSRIWRLQQYQYPEADSLQRGAPGEEGEGVSPDSLRVLQERLSQLRDSSSPSGLDAPSPPGPQGAPSQAAAAPPAAAGSSSSGGASGEAAGGAAVRSFSDADDDELTWALNKRISEVAVSTGEWGATVDEEDMRKPLTGEEVQQLLMTKYGKLYDMSFAKRSIPGKTFVALNIMWLHLGQRSFKLTAEQYAEKIDGVAQLVNVLGQTDKVRAFLSAPAKSQKGLPPRPVVGTAISIRLDLDDSQVAEWFGAGYD